MPVEPPPTRWQLPDPWAAGPADIVALGADLEPGTLLAGYRAGLFAMPAPGLDEIAWWSPEPRGILPLDALRVTRSLRRSCRRFEIRVDTAFAEVVAACADPARPHGWISPAMRAAYERLHALGWAHSVEAWTPDGELAGGLFGVEVGGLFAGESMFHRRTDASKVALVALVERLAAAAGGPARLLDVQWRTPHLAALGAIAVPRRKYLQRLAAALALPGAF